ncbi:MAG: ATP-binding cassette domain-containing protein, partial [Bacteroidia bacterium]|nr:ATP-binding cassette domain-containing protein [Bacteroidia bacterium]
LPCENCNGHRFKQEVLEVTHDDKHITDVLNMTIDEALDFFYDQKRILTKLQILSDVGLGYIKLGQSSTTLSGGEAQRVKLAYYLCQGANDDHTVYIFDEPTTGLHFHDINKLLRSLNALIEKGNTVIIIEHNPDVIKCADWVIDLGPDGGDAGGNIIFEGTPKEIKNCKESYTGEFI